MVVGRKLHEVLMADLLGEILAGRFPAGDLLPREVDLAGRYGVSRGVARQAIQALRDRGVLVVRHGVGAMVLPMARWQLFDEELLDALLRGRGARERRSQFAEALTPIWSTAVRLAAERRTPEDVEAIDQAVQDIDAFVQALVTAARNPFLGRLLDVGVGRLLGDPDLPARQAIADAIERRDPAAAESAAEGYLRSTIEGRPR